LLALLSSGEDNLQAKCAAKFLLDLHDDRQYATSSWAIALPAVRLVKSDSADKWDAGGLAARVKTDDWRAIMGWQEFTSRADKVAPFTSALPKLIYKKTD